MDNCRSMSDPIIVTVLFVQLSVALCILIVSTKAVVNTIEIGHPMYALLYQEAIVLAVFVTLKLSLLVAMSIVDGYKVAILTGIYLASDVAALQFHQVTCLSVACLRYYLLYVPNTNPELNMSKIFKTSFIAVWLAEIIFMPLCQMPWVIGLTNSGWPTISFEDLAQNNPWLLIKLLYITMIVSNVPDFLSIVLYTKMFSKAKRTVEPDIVLQDEPYGGIWVGDNEHQVENRGSNNVESSSSSDQQQQDRMKSILKLLRWNTIFCLIDMTSGVVWDNTICKSRLATITGYTFHNFVCYGIPMLVLGSNFRFFENIFCCKNRSPIAVIC